MVTELRLQNQAQQLYTRALSQAYRNRHYLPDPSLWLLRDPEVEEKMLRDADIAHAVGYRRHLIAGRNWSCMPKSVGSPRADMAVGIATDLLSNIRSFTAARLGLARAFFSGARFARIVGVTRTETFGDGKPRQWWVPIALQDEDKRIYRIVPDQQAGEPVHTHWERWNIGASEWQPITEGQWRNTICHVYDDDQSSLGYGRALRESLGWLWYAKENIFSESLQAVERFAQGIVTAKVDGIRDAASGMPNEELISSWQDVLSDLRSRHVLVHDSSDTIEIKEGSSTGWQLLTQMREELRSSIFTLVLGANLSTAASSGGSYALAAVQENSTEALIQYDRENLEQTLTEDLIGACWANNWANIVELGLQREMPRFNISQEKRQDPTQRTASAVQLAQAGLPLALDDIYEQTGFRKPDEGEATLQPKPAAPVAAPGAMPWL